VTEIGDSNTGLTVEVDGGTPFVLTWAAATNVGRKRAANEDSFVAKFPIFAVADGMGGHSAGDVASAAVVTRLGEIATGSFIETAAVERALQLATDDITLVGETEFGIGTTVTGVALTMHEGEAYFAVFNIGDSRVYLLDHNELSQLTVDHSVVQELVDAGQLTREEAELHPDSNIITRAVGFGVVPSADLWLLPSRPGLRLLVCSDGLTKEVSDDRIRLHLAAGLTPVETGNALIDAALAAGGRDNITTIVVDVHEAIDRDELDGDVEDTAPRGRRVR
jgi:serine/threonine protein phosphatase PrpC